MRLRFHQAAGVHRPVNSYDTGCTGLVAVLRRVGGLPARRTTRGGRLLNPLCSNDIVAGARPRDRTQLRQPVGSQGAPGMALDTSHWPSPRQIVDSFTDLHVAKLARRYESPGERRHRRCKRAGSGHDARSAGAQRRVDRRPRRVRRHWRPSGSRLGVPRSVQLAPSKAASKVRAAGSG